MPSPGGEAVKSGNKKPVSFGTINIGPKPTPIIDTTLNVLSAVIFGLAIGVLTMLAIGAVLK